MGQQLNLEFKQQDVVIGNAYYYNGGYTDEAIAIAKKALTKLVSIDGDNLSPRLRAFYAMHATGARMTADDYHLALSEPHITDEERSAFTVQFGYYEKPANRGDGLISLSTESMKETEKHSVNTITVDLDTLKMHFDCMYFEEDTDALMDSYELCEEDLEDIPLYKEPFNLLEMSLSDIPVFEKALELAKTNNNLIFKTPKNEFHIMIG